ncbi:MAG: hypothetical protein IKJ88_05560 [Clostridia bacterium]|nr:hypothetical protein [Clostridia bacterium]
MKFYLNDKLLFVDMHHHYTHAVVEGEDRVICCQKSEAAAKKVCLELKMQKGEILNEMNEILIKGHAYSSPKKTAYGIDFRELYPTAGLLVAAVHRLERNINSIRVEPLTVTA